MENSEEELIDVLVNMNFINGLWCKQMHFLRAGALVPGHKHLYDHMTLLAHGSLSVTVNNKVTEFVAPQIIYIKKNVVHDLVALEADTVAYCIHIVKNAETGDILEGIGRPDGIAESFILK